MRPNVDIGGGTTNLAWFDAGRLLDAGAIRVGGRHLIRQSDADQPFRVASETAGRFLSRATATQQDAARWIEACTQHTVSAIKGHFETIPDAFIVTNPQQDLPEARMLFFSGGVCDIMARLDRGESVPDAFRDTGLQLYIRV